MARLLLAARAGDATAIGDIAFRCGFYDRVYLSRLFYQRFGLTPTAFRAAAGLGLRLPVIWE